MNKYIKCDEVFIDQITSLCNSSATAMMKVKEFLESYPAATNIIEVNGEEGNEQD